MARVDMREALAGWQELAHIHRRTGEWSEGTWVEGTAEEISFYGVFLDPDYEELLLLPEGNRTKDHMKVYTTAQLFSQQSDVEDQSGDLIFYRDHYWQVVQLSEKDIGGYYLAIVQRVKWPLP